MIEPGVAVYVKGAVAGQQERLSSRVDGPWRRSVKVYLKLVVSTRRHIVIDGKLFDSSFACLGGQLAGSFPRCAGPSRIGSENKKRRTIQRRARCVEGESIGDSEEKHGRACNAEPD